jgi:hypothetical protein
MSDNSTTGNTEQTHNTGGNGAESQGADMPLFYHNPEPLDAQRHGNLGLTANFDFSFTREVNAVPINMIEMPQLCHYYPIAFSPDENATPVVLLGLRDGENLFVDSQGNWLEHAYIPAYIRRYPFIFSELPDSDQLTLCVDMNSDGVAEDTDQPFFDSEGNATELANNAMEFCKSYHAAAQQTMAFSRALADADLLVERQAELNVAGGRKLNFSGFRIIDEEKFGQLDNDTFLQWREKGWLPFIYAHLFSGAQWQRLTRLLNERLDGQDAASS